MKRTSLAALIGLSLTGIPASAATLTSGHVDFIGIGYDGGELEPHSHAHAGAVVDGVTLGADTEYEAGDLTVQVYSTTGRSAGAAWDPIGVASGETYNLLHETEVAGKPFVGIGAEELTPADWVDGEITIKLTAMNAPVGAVFSLWQTNAGVPTFFMSTLDGIGASDTFLMDLDDEDHAHFGWGFTEEGTYDLTFEISGAHGVDGFKSATATYSFSVIPEPSSALLGAIGALGLLRRRR